MAKDPIEPIPENFDALAEAYRPLFLTIIKKGLTMYRRHERLEHEDLMQEALWALHDAIRGFDPTRGIYFGVSLKRSVENRLRCAARDFLPHYYIKDQEKSAATGKPQFKRMAVDVGSTEEKKYKHQ